MNYNYVREVAPVGVLERADKMIWDLNPTAKHINYESCFYETTTKHYMIGYVVQTNVVTREGVLVDVANEVG